MWKPSGFLAFIIPYAIFANCQIGFSNLHSSIDRGLANIWRFKNQISNQVIVKTLMHRFTMVFVNDKYSQGFMQITKLNNVMLTNDAKDTKKLTIERKVSKLLLRFCRLLVNWIYVDNTFTTSFTFKSKNLLPPILRGNEHEVRLI